MADYGVVDGQLVNVADFATDLLQQRLAAESAKLTLDVADWAHSNFYIPNPKRLIRLHTHQVGVLRHVLTRGPDGHYRYNLVIYSTVKKSGKSTISGIPIRYVAETQTDHGEVYCLGNDLKQARSRGFKFARQSITLTPGYRRFGAGGEGELPDRWYVQRSNLTCIQTGTTVEAIPIDPEGESGGNPDLSVWTELWGMTHDAELRMWEEMTVPPTKPDGMRWVETYAGFTGESVLLEDLYKLGLDGRQMTNDEWAKTAHREQPGYTYDEMLNAFVETNGDPQALVPIWVNDKAALFMFWDEGETARRMPWLQGDDGARYYSTQEAQVPPNQMLRQHGNHWVGSEEEFVPIQAWDRLMLPVLPKGEAWRPGTLPYFDPDVIGLGAPPDQWERVILAADAAVSKDCFGVMAITRHPDPDKRHDSVAIRACRAWEPPKGGQINFHEAEAFLRTLCQGGCVRGHPQYADWPCVGEKARGLYDVAEDCIACVNGLLVNGYYVIQIAYDEFQLHDMMQRIRREGIVATKVFGQGQDRLIADAKLADLIYDGRLAHPGVYDDDGQLVPEFPMLRQHMTNANRRTAPQEDTKLRIVKRGKGKIDLVVCASMGSYRALKLAL